MPSLKLKGPELERLFDALVDVFDVASLRPRLALAVEDESVVARMVENWLRAIVFDLMVAAEEGGWTTELIAGLQRVRGSRPALAAFFGAMADTAQPGPLKPPLLTQKAILQIHDLLTAAGFATTDSIVTLLAGIDRPLRAGLSRVTAVASEDLMRVLNGLNEIGEQGDGQIPLENFLETAAYLARAHPEMAAGLNLHKVAIRQR